MLETIKIKFYNLLKWSEKYTKTDMVYLAKGGFWLNFNYVITSLIGLVLYILFANFVSKDLYGNYKYILSIIGIISATTLSGMNATVTRYVAKGYEGIFKKSFFVQIKWSIIPFFIATISSLYFYYNHNINISISLIIAGVLMPLTNSANTFLAFLNGKKDFKKYFIYNSLVYLGYAISIIFAIFFFKNVIALIFFNFASLFLLNLLFYFITIKQYKPNEKYENKSISDGKHLSVMNILSTFSSQIDSVLVFHYLGASQLAIYSFALILPEKIRGFFKFIPTIALPKMTMVNSDEIHSSVMKKIKPYVLMWVLITIIYIIIAPVFFKIFLPQYTASVIYTQIFAISLIATVSQIPSSALISQMNKKGLYNYSILTAVFQIFILFIMIKYFNLLGAILAKVMSCYFNLFYSFYIFKKHLKTKEVAENI